MDDYDPDTLARWEASLAWKAARDTRAAGRLASCTARYGPVLCRERRGDDEFHWHGRFHGHVLPDDPLEHRDMPCR
jgi:hypothetical protein